jgi:type II secretory pathway component PulL
MASGALKEIWLVSRTLSVCGDTIFLQQSWPWLAGSHDIVRQHSIVCWSADIAMQSANCASRMKLAAATKDVIFRNIRFP